MDTSNLQTVSAPVPAVPVLLGIEEAHDAALKAALLLEVLQEELQNLEEEYEKERRSLAKGRRQIPRRLPTVPAPFNNYDGSFMGIPDDWADHLKPKPMNIRTLLVRDEPFSAMRILQHPIIKDDGIWVKRGGRCMCFYNKALVGLGIAQRVHPYYSKCWKQGMFKLPPREKDQTPIALWHKDKRSPWGGWYVGASSKVKIFDLHSMPIRKIYAVNMTDDDKELARLQTLHKYSEWVSKPKVRKLEKPVVTLALLRTVRIVRKQIMQLRSDVLSLNQ